MFLWYMPTSTTSAAISEYMHVLKEARQVGTVVTPLIPVLRRFSQEDVERIAWVLYYLSIKELLAY